MTTAARKGASRAADIPAPVLQALSRGELPSATLAEALALDQATLLRTVFPGLPPAALAAADTACTLGILKRMDAIAAVLLAHHGAAAIATCRLHAADSVREWAWMAVRPHLAADLDTAIAHLAAWTDSPSDRLRRFACEALRPRGVWCAHIAALKREPARMLPILAPLRADPSPYVQDSVGNWLNDAAKDQPDWVRQHCAQWQRDTPGAATARICQRALRNLA